MKIFVKTFVQSSICALSIILLLSGQQAFSAALTSAAAGINGFTDTLQWSKGLCGAPIDNPNPSINPGDTFTICSGHALTLGFATTDIAGITVDSVGSLIGTLTLGAATVPLTMSPNGILTNNGGTISTDIGAHVLSNIVHTTGSTTLTAANMTSISGYVTYTAGTLELPTALTTINGLFSALLASPATYVMPTTITSLAGGSILGVLKLKDAAHTISGATGSIAILDLSVSAPATTAATAITFTPLLGETITINGFVVPATASISLTCIGTADGNVTSPVTSTTSSGDTYSCTGIPVVISPISAPIFSTKGKAKVFIEEVI